MDAFALLNQFLDDLVVNPPKGARALTPSETCSYLEAAATIIAQTNLLNKANAKHGAVLFPSSDRNLMTLSLHFALFFLRSSAHRHDRDDGHEDAVVGLGAPLFVLYVHGRHLQPGTRIDPPLAHRGPQDRARRRRATLAPCFSRTP